MAEQTTAKMLRKLSESSRNNKTTILLIIAFVLIGLLIAAIGLFARSLAVNNQRTQIVYADMEEEQLRQQWWNGRFEQLENKLAQLQSLVFGQKVLKIGVLLPETGNASYIGQSLRVALADAISQAKAAHPSYNLVVEFRDTAGNEHNAVAAFQFLYSKGFRVFIGPAMSGALRTVAEMAPEDAIFLSPTATATELGLLTNTLLMSPDNMQLAKVLLQRLQRFKIRQIIMLYRDDVYGRSMRNALLHTNQQTREPTEMFFVPYSVDDTNYYSPIASEDIFHMKILEQVEAIRTREDARHTAVVVVARDEIERLLELGSDIPLVNDVPWLTTDTVAVGSDRLIRSEKARAFAKQVFLTGFAFAGDQFVAYKRIKEVDSLREQLGDTPTLQSLLAYDTINLLISAYNTYGQLPTRQLVNRLRYDEFRFNGLSGVIQFNEHGIRSEGSYAIMSYMPDVSINLVDLPSDSNWVLQAFHNIKDDVEVGSADEFKKDKINDFLLTKGLQCSRVDMQVFSKDTFSHRPLVRNYTLATMPNTVLIQATFGWYATVSCVKETPSSPVSVQTMDVACGPAELDGRRDCWSRIEGEGPTMVFSMATGFRRRLLQKQSQGTVSSASLICALIDPLCSTMTSLFTTLNVLPAGSSGIASIIIEGICDFGQLGCDIVQKLEKENVISTGSSVICTELYRQGRLPIRLYMADHEFGRQLLLTNPSAVSGYQLWATPLVSLMQRSSFVSDIFEAMATPWAEEMAYRMGDKPQGNIVGSIMLAIGLPVCSIIGYAYANAGLLIGSALTLFLVKRLLFASNN